MRARRGEEPTIDVTGLAWAYGGTWFEGNAYNAAQIRENNLLGYRLAFVGRRMGTASALALIMFYLVVGVATLYLRLMRKREATLATGH